MLQKLKYYSTIRKGMHDIIKNEEFKPQGLDEQMKHELLKTGRDPAAIRRVV